MRCNFVWLLAILSSQRPGFNPWPFHATFIVDKVVPRQVSFPSTSVLPYQYRSTNGLYESSSSYNSYKEKQANPGNIQTEQCFLVYRKSVVEDGNVTRFLQAADFEVNFEGRTFSAPSTETLKWNT